MKVTEPLSNRTTIAIPPQNLLIQPRRSRHFANASQSVTWTFWGNSQEGAFSARAQKKGPAMRTPPSPETSDRDCFVGIRATCR